MGLQPCLAIVGQNWANNLHLIDASASSFISTMILQVILGREENYVCGGKR